jgi:hypothetical protein
MKEVIINKVSVVNNEKIEFVIFPNPGSGLFKFSYNLNDSKLKWLKVNDMNGACVFHINQPDTYLNESMELDLRNLVNGVYNIELNVDNNILNTKLIIVK